jgi:hypothetical protein
VARIFISHASRDREAADQIAQWLRSQGFEELFLDIDKDAGMRPLRLSFSTPLSHLPAVRLSLAASR